MTSTETGTSWSDRLSPRNWSLAWKLVAVGLVPALLAVTLGVLRVADQARAASDLETANQLFGVRNVVADAADALRVERDLATAFVAERRSGDRGPLEQAAERSDTTLEQARAALNRTDGVDATTRAAMAEAEGGFSQLGVLRGDVNGTAPLAPAQVVGRYTTVVGRTDVLARSLLRQVSTPEVAGLADALNAATTASEALARQHTVLGAALRLGRISADDRAAVNATDSALSNGYSSYLLALGPAQNPVNFLNSPENAQRDALKTAIVGAPDEGPIPVTVPQWDAATQASTDRITAATAEVRDRLAAAGDTAAGRASNLAGLNSVFLMLGLLLAAAIIVLVTRSLTRSLRVLRSSALDVAQRRLPQAVENMRAGNAPDVAVEPVPLRNRDEVGQVARAFDAVHEQALRLAADQAALQGNVSSMFVNLSRRSQGLVERQLQLIEQLESNEQDPDQLSNLFQLDHLATRMRRNSENLLVLAGTDFAKRNVAPVPLVDVLRAAVSEIEHYQRITVQAPPQATVVGRATSDIVHLLAELLDNATNFSPPDSQVVMSSTRTGDGSIVVEIADLGVGMLENELADANRRLNTPSAVDVSASRRMGLFVVGRLGARHGISVHLGGAPRGGPGGGLTASVTLPAHLVVSSSDGGGRPSAGTGTFPPVAPPNGVPPQRAGRPERPAAHAGVAAAADGQAPAALNGLHNGLPTRTPGSTLRRGSTRPTGENADDTAVDPFSSDRGQPFADERTDASRPPARRSEWRDPRDADPGHTTTPPAGVGRRANSWAGAPPRPDRPPREQVPPADGAGPAGSTRMDPASLPNRGSGDRRPAASSPGARDDAAAGAPEADAPATAGRATAPDEAQGRAGDAEGRGRDGAVRAPGGADERGPVEGAAPDGDRADGDAADQGTDRTEGDTDGAAEGTADDATRDGADSGPATERADEGQPDGRALQPHPGRGANGARRGPAVPPTPYAVPANGHAGAPNGAGHHGEQRVGPPSTTPLPVVPGRGTPPPTPFGAPVAAGPDGDGDPDALFAASVPAIAEPDGMSRPRRPVGELRRNDADDLTEPTPIFAEIASAWFASDRPVPVDWELGQRPGAEPEQRAPVAPSALDVPDRPGSVEWLTPPQAVPAVPVEPSAQAFATAADEGWRAASGVAAERPDELTAAGLPKRRPRARLVPGSAGSAVLAAPTAPTRSAESIRGRLASYQQGVRQGREVRLNRDPDDAGDESAPNGQNGAPRGGDGNEDNR